MLVPPSLFWVVRPSPPLGGAAFSFSPVSGAVFILVLLVGSAALFGFLCVVLPFHFASFLPLPVSGAALGGAASSSWVNSFSSLSLWAVLLWAVLLPLLG